MGLAPTHGSPRRLDTTRIESSGTEATVAPRTTARTTTHTHTVWWLGVRTCAMPHIPHSIILKVTRHISSPRNMKVVWVNGWLNDRSGHVPSSDALGDPWMDSVPLGVHCPVAFCMSASLVEIWGRERRGGGGVGVGGRVRVGVRVGGMDGGKDLQCARVKAARARARRPGGSGLCRGTPGTTSTQGVLKDTFSLCRPLPPRTVLIEPVTSMPLARNQSQQVFMVTGTNGEAETRAKAREREQRAKPVVGEAIMESVLNPFPSQPTLFVHAQLPATRGRWHLARPPHATWVPCPHFPLQEQELSPPPLSNPPSPHHGNAVAPDRFCAALGRGHPH